MFSLFSFDVKRLDEGTEEDCRELEQHVRSMILRFNHVQLLSLLFCFHFAHTQESSLRAELLILNNRFTGKARVDYFLTHRSESMGVMTNTRDRTLASRLISMGLKVSNK